MLCPMIWFGSMFSLNAFFGSLEFASYNCTGGGGATTDRNKDLMNCNRFWYIHLFNEHNILTIEFLIYQFAYHSYMNDHSGNDNA